MNFHCKIKANPAETKVIWKVKVKTANETDAGTTEDLEISVCEKSICCTMKILNSPLSEAESYTLSGKALDECELRKFPKTSEYFNVTLSLLTNKDSDSDEWLNEKVEIEFSNNETISCNNNQRWIQDFQDPEKASDTSIILRCWKDYDPTLIGNKKSK